MTVGPTWAVDPKTNIWVICYDGVNLTELTQNRGQ